MITAPYRCNFGPSYANHVSHYVVLSPKHDKSIMRVGVQPGFLYPL